MAPAPRGARRSRRELGSGPVRAAALPGGRRLVLRPIRPADVDQLERLYDGLSVDDRYRRFFSVYHPPRSMFEKWARGEDEGCRLVAVVDGPGPDGVDAQIVAEGCYVMLPDGDGEFALTVAPDWRGWLGPYLLDALAEDAARSGVRNLQADILTQNRPMLAIVHARGYAVMNHDGFTEVRLTTGTEPRTPAWPGEHDRPRLLVEASGGRWRAEHDARAAGYHVMICPGPFAGRTPRCPGVCGEECPLAAGADAIVFALRPDRPRAAELLAAHGKLHRDVPLCVDLSPVDAAALPVPDGSTMLDRAAAAPAVVAALRVQAARAAR